MIVLSLFDGMSCGRVALERAKINIEKYYASEIDPHALKIAEKNYPDNINLYDINNFCSLNDGTHIWRLLPYSNCIDYIEEKIDLIIGGSPCQGFSFAGKQLAFDDPRSALFWKYVEIVKYYKPKYFLLENVRMKKEHLQVITDALGVEPICINSALVSAQNRVRYYWTNIPGVKQPEDKGIVLKDIIEHGVCDRDKSLCIDANYWKGGNLKQYFEKHRRQLVFQINPDKSAGGKQPHMQDRVYHEDGKSVALTASFSNRINIFQKGHGFNKGGILKSDKSPSLTSNSWQHNNFLLEDFTVRKLTPVECERLQTLPDNYTQGVSNTQRYKMLGNGWTVDVIAHIFKGILD